MPPEPSDFRVIRIQEGLVKTKQFVAEIPIPVKAYLEIDHGDGRKEILLDPFNTNADPRYFLMWTYLYKQFVNQIGLTCVGPANAYLYHPFSFSSPSPDNLLSANILYDQTSKTVQHEVIFSYRSNTTTALSFGARIMNQAVDLACDPPARIFTIPSTAYEAYATYKWFLRVPYQSISNANFTYQGQLFFTASPSTPVLSSSIVPTLTITAYDSSGTGQLTSVSPTYAISARWVDSFTQETVLSIVFNNPNDVGKIISEITLNITISGTGGYSVTAFDLWLAGGFKINATGDTIQIKWVFRLAPYQ